MNVKPLRGEVTCWGLAGLALLAVPGAAAQAAQSVCTPTWSASAAANTAALQRAIDTCAAAGSAAVPGLVDLAPGGGVAAAQIVSVTLRSNLVLKLEAGFTLRGPDPASVGYTGTGAAKPPAMLTGSHLSHVTITGAGTLDGNGAPYWAIFNRGGHYAKQDRPRIVKLTGSHLQIGANFSAAGASAPGVAFPFTGNDLANILKIRDAAKEQVTIEAGSSDVLIDGVWISAPTGRATLGTGSNKNVAPNTDGIDLVGVNPSGVGTAVVQNCVIDTGDDNIAIKSNTKAAPAYNVTVTGCLIGGGHGLSIGGQETGGVGRVQVSQIWFKGTDYGFRIKTDNTSKDSGTTSGVTYAASCMLQVGEPILLTYNYNGSASGGRPPVIENVAFDNIVAVAGATPGRSAALGAVEGLVDDLLARNISIRNSSITGAGASAFKVTYGTLQLGSQSTLATKLGSGGSLLPVSDAGPSVTCPAGIAIPPQP